MSSREHLLTVFCPLKQACALLRGLPQEFCGSHSNGGDLSSDREGLEPPSPTRNTMRVSNVSIIVAQAPALAAALEDLYQSDRGLALSDVVGAIAALEDLIIEESARLLNDCYFLNGITPDEPVTESMLHELLRSYLLIFRWGAPANLTDVKGHKAMKMNAANASDWGALVQFERDTIQASLLEPEDGLYSPMIVGEILREMLQKYGKWQNRECIDMKRTLVGLTDPQASGLVPWERFHAEPDHDTFQFTESLDYLRQIGVLEEGEGSNRSQVRIANYLLGPSNCIAPSAYYTVCCLSECESLISEVETATQSPVSTPEQLIGVVEGTADAGRNLPEAIVNNLRGVAEHYEGLVPLHSA
eukprot:CAMPEP_0115172970 /NCGR_PEP_ID=MMETSP0270-20121206/3089_1 /TAXON_ID=71861 /ORGANISM="Scrippsiella trochoidea, Strain CCMP3099" /LENGTH=358 /DNA_ID=CAMNT_0002585777 /DNA_START=52 /DNA_END=1126 /DNA_ORIENTATION=+